MGKMNHGTHGIHGTRGGEQAVFCVLRGHPSGSYSQRLNAPGIRGQEPGCVLTSHGEVEPWNSEYAEWNGPFQCIQCIPWSSLRIIFTAAECAGHTRAGAPVRADNSWGGWTMELAEYAEWNGPFQCIRCIPWSPLRSIFAVAECAGGALERAAFGHIMDRWV
jgi:hypothetical protein